MAEPAMKFQMRVDIKKLAADIRDIGDAEMLRKLRAANKEAAQAVVPHIVARIPVGERPTRRKRLHQTVRAVGARTSARIKVGGAKYPYAYSIHSGDRAHTGRGKEYQSHHNRGGVKFLSEGFRYNIAEFYKTHHRVLEEVTREFNAKHGVK